MSVEVGQLAPDFELVNQHGEAVSLSSYRGNKPVTLVFYPLSFSGTCTGELCALRDNLASFQEAGSELIAVSVDSKFTQKAFASQEGYEFQLLADFWPHGEVAKKYGVFREDAGVASRTTFIINKEGVVVDKFQSAPGEERPIDQYQAALANL